MSEPTRPGALMQPQTEAPQSPGSDGEILTWDETAQLRWRARQPGFLKHIGYEILAVVIFLTVFGWLLIGILLLINRKRPDLPTFLGATGLLLILGAFIGIIGFLRGQEVHL